MMKKHFLQILLILMGVIISLTGCRWFADNPMFPTGKISITVDKTYIGVKEEQTGTEDNIYVKRTIDRDVTFNFRSLNNVGVELTKCTIKYRNTDGIFIDSLTRDLDIYLLIIPSGIPLSKESTYDTIKQEPTPTPTASPTTSQSSITLQIFDPNTEGYLRSNKITTAVAQVIFVGQDLAGHELQSFKKEININVYQGIPEGDLGKDFVLTTVCEETCDGIKAFLQLDAADPDKIDRVEFFINGKSAGVSSNPPFQSTALSFNDDTSCGIEYSCKDIKGYAIIYDIFGNSTIVNTPISNTQ